MKREERRDMILQYAKALFSDKGYYQTQISDIMEAAGVARGTIYQYFKNKDDLFSVLLEGYLKKYEDMVSEAVRELDLGSITAMDYLRFRIRTTLLFFAGDPDICNTLLRVGLGLPPHFDAVITRFEERITVIITNDLMLGRNNGHVRDDLDMELAANMLAGAVLRCAYFYFGRNGQGGVEVDIDAATEQITEVVANGIFVHGQ
ncbi:MAG: TetR/AcrR family transcriptional regulator [Desulfatibacillaceae bacterium]